MNFFIKNRIKALLSCLFLLLISTNYLSAQNGEGIKFSAQPDVENLGVNFMWFIDDSNQTPTQVEVWIERGVFYDISDMKDAELFTMLTSEQWTADRGMYQSFISHQFEPGYYTFYLSITFSDGTVRTSNTSPVGFYVTDPGRYLEFTSIPIEKSFVGENYSYTAVAIDPEDENAEIEYFLVSQPEGMEINQATGEISWTPKERGVFEVWVQAVSKSDPSVFGEQYFYITVFSCKNPAKISGNITDTQGNPVSMGYVSLISEDFENRPDNGWQAYGLVENGKYTLEADEGKYYLIFQDMYGYYEFYPNAFEIEDAELIEVACGDEKTIDMKLSKYKNSVMYTVKGNVSTEDGSPVPYANVMFEGLWDDDDNSRSAFFWAYTDESGNYEVELPDAYTFIASVDAYWDPTTGLSKTLYYNQTYNREEATKIVLTGDLEGIDFVIPKDIEFKYYKVSGNVSMEDGTPVENATVIFEGLYDASGQKYPYYGNQVMTDAEGNYSLELPELFNYKAYVVTMNDFLYRPLYYNQTYNPDEAEVITLTADRDDINFVLSEPDFEMYTVSGKVSKEDGTPIEGATVMFEGFNESPDYYYNRWSQSVTTDSEGKYEIKLPEMFKYIAYAFDVTFYDRYNSMMPLYYNQTYNPEEATIIELTSDLTDIDFVFSNNPNDEYKSSISGTVEDEAGNPVEGVYLMVYNVNSDPSSDGNVYDGRATISNQSGEFKFISLMPGSYVLLAVPKTLDNVPGFYKEGSTVVMNWDEATVINVAEDENVSGIRVILGTLGIPQNAEKGLCQVSGRVKAISNTNPLDRISVGGAVIYIEDSEGKMKTYATSNNDGSFNLKNLPNGEMVLKVEKLGYQPYSKNINFDEIQNYDVGEILLTPEALSVNDGKSRAVNIFAYPNPAKDKLAVSFESRTDNVQITLVNTVGKMVWTSPVKTVRGSNNITLDVSGFANGAYFVIIDNGVYSTAYPVTIQR